MRDPFERFAGMAAVLVGILSVLYAVFYLIVAAQNPTLGGVTSWLILAASGFLSIAVVTGLYMRLRTFSAGYALYALLFGVGLGLVHILNGTHQALQISSGTPGLAISALDPKGVSFVLFAAESFLFGWLIVSSGALPRGLGYLGMLNALFLVVLFASNVFGLTSLVLLSGGPSSLILTPLWYIWVGRQLMQPASAPAAMKGKESLRSATY